MNVHVISDPQILVKVPENFSGEDKSKDIRVWFRDYERTCEANGWDHAKRHQILPAFLIGKAGKFNDFLEIGLNFDQVKQKLFEKFSPHGESGISWAELTARYQQPHESIEDFADAISRLVHASLPRASPSELAETKLRNFVYLALPQYQQFLLQRNIDHLTFDDAILLAKRQEAAIKQLRLYPAHCSQMQPQQISASPFEDNYAENSRIFHAIEQLSQKIVYKNEPEFSQNLQPLPQKSLEDRVSRLEMNVSGLTTKLDDIHGKVNEIAANLNTRPTIPSLQMAKYCHICQRRNHNTEECRSLPQNRPRNQAPVASNPVAQRRPFRSPTRRFQFPEN